MLHITFRQLEAFYWAATLGTVNAASKHLCISQPAVTARIKELEEILGINLFSRSLHGVQLTTGGQEVLTHAQNLLTMGKDLEQCGRHEVPPLDGLLRLGADDSSAAVAVSEILRVLKIQFPRLRVALSIEVSKVLHEKINRRELDVVLQTSPVARPQVVDELLGWVEVAWVAGASAELTPLPFSPGNAAIVSVLTNPAPSVLHYVAREWLSRGGNEFHHLNTCNSLSTIMKIVQDGHAIAALPMPVVLEKLKLGALKLVEADPPLPQIAYYVSYLMEKQDLGVGRIITLAKEVLKATHFFVEQPPSSDEPK